jgi:hypothetical protein
MTRSKRKREKEREKKEGTWQRIMRLLRKKISSSSSQKNVCVCMDVVPLQNSLSREELLLLSFILLLIH